MSKTDKQKLPPVEIFFDVRDSSYWFKVKGRYLQLGKSDLKLHLQRLGFSQARYREDGICEMDFPFLDAMENNQIDYAGSLAGHRVGIFRGGNNRKFLVTDEAFGAFDELPKKIKEPEFFAAFLSELLGEQTNHFCHWLALALFSLRRGDFRPGQVMALVGESGCGKSLLQQIITQVLGGRSANPFEFLMGADKFNQDLVGSEHWAIEDPASTTDIRTRRLFGNKLKEAIVNVELRVNRKGKDAVMLKIFRRVTISVNNEPENLAVIPPLDDSLIDKIFLLRCAKVQKAFDPFRTKEGTPALFNGEKSKDDLDRKALWQAVVEELPLIRAFLLDRFKNVPASLRDDRYGVKSWQHPELFAALSSMALEVRFLNIVDEILFAESYDDKGMRLPNSAWEGKSPALELVLRKSEFAFEAAKVLHYANQCGNHLAKLAKTHPDRISGRKVEGYTVWTIKPPSLEKK